jgi:acyl carrier protein
MGVTMRDIILSEIRSIAIEQNKKLAPLSDTLPLLDSGLDSLCMAILVARLEDRFGIDPFASADEAVIPITVGDFVAFYAKANS